VWRVPKLEPVVLTEEEQSVLAGSGLRAHAAAGRHDTLRVLLQRLRTALQGIDEEPAAETLALAAQLRTAPPHSTTGTARGADKDPDTPADRTADPAPDSAAASPR
jgi:hypothetical protein